MVRGHAADIVVVGAGVMGASLAFRLARPWEYDDN